MLWTRTRFGVVAFDSHTLLQLCKELSKLCTRYRATITVANFAVFFCYTKYEEVMHFFILCIYAFAVVHFSMNAFVLIYLWIPGPIP